MTSRPLPAGRIVFVGFLGGVAVFYALWQAAAAEPTASRVCLSLLGASGGLLFGGMLGLVAFDREAPADRGDSPAA